MGVGGDFVLCWCGPTPGPGRMLAGWMLAGAPGVGGSLCVLCVDESEPPAHQLPISVVIYLEDSQP